jgi:uncharacterized membrane protein
MSDPTNPNGDWQQVPTTPSDPAASNLPPNPGAGYPPPNYPPQQPPPGYAPQAGGLSSNSAAAISYLTFIPAIIFLVMDPYKRDPFVRFHSIQSIALNVVGFAIGLAFFVLATAMYSMGMGLMVTLIHGVIDLILFVGWLMAIIQASQGKWFKLPIIGDFSMKQSQSL